MHLGTSAFLYWTVSRRNTEMVQGRSIKSGHSVATGPC